MKNVIHRIKLYLLKREIAKWNAHISHLRQAQLEIIRTLFVLKNKQLQRQDALNKLISDANPSAEKYLPVPGIVIDQSAYYLAAYRDAHQNARDAYYSTALHDARQNVRDAAYAAATESVFNDPKD